MTACSAESLRVQEPLIGSAPVAQCWIVIEQPGPWGREALVDSHLDVGLGERLAELAAGTGTRLVLARHPDRLERTVGATRNIWVAHTAPGTTRLRHGVDDPAIVATWDLAAMANGSLPEFGTPTVDPVLFICTHSGRDACCAVHGRQLVGEVLDRVPADARARIWETSHLGGHRFAPTALALPSGDVFGRLTLADAMTVIADESARIVSLASLRGRSAFPAPLQVADAAVRRDFTIIDRDVLDVLWVRGDRCVPVQPGQELEEIASMLTEVRHVDGRAWRVTVRHEPLPEPRAESCGKAAVEGYAWRAVAVEPTEPWA